MYKLKIDAAERGPMAQRVYGFSDLEVTPKMLTLRHLDESGRLIHAFAKRPDGTMSLLSGT